MKIHQTEGDGDILAFLTGQVIPLEFSLLNRHVKTAPKLNRGLFLSLAIHFTFYCILCLLNCAKSCLD